MGGVAVLRIRKIPELREQGRKLVLHWNERQVATLGISDAAIRRVRDAFKRAHLT